MSDTTEATRRGPNEGHDWLSTKYVDDWLSAFHAGGDPDQSGADLPAPGGSRSAGDPVPVPMSLEHQLVMLRDAGFADVECLWRTGTLALLCARNGR